MVVTSRCFNCFSRANHASTNLKKVLSCKPRQVYFIHPFPRRLKLGTSLETCCVNFFRLSWHFKREKNRILESIFFPKQKGLITRTSFVYKTSRLVKICLLISALSKRVLLFFLEKLFYKSNRKLFPVFAYPDSYANPRLRLGFASLSLILPTPLVFISENVFYCLNVKGGPFVNKRYRKEQEP